MSRGRIGLVNDRANQIEYDSSLSHQDHFGSPVASPRAWDVPFALSLSRAIASGGDAKELWTIGREIRRVRALRGYSRDVLHGKFWKFTWIMTILWVPVSFMVSSFLVMSEPVLKPYPWGLVAVMMIPPGFLYGVVVMICWVIVLSRRGTARIGSKVRINPNCVKCHYDLSGTIPMIQPSKLRGTWTGPERCPECGLVWPLIPKELGGQRAASAAAEEGRD